MKKAIIIGVACLTAGIGLAGCGASNTTIETTTTVETTTTTAETSESTTQTESTTTATTEKVTETTVQAISEETINKLYDEIINNYYVIQQSCEGILYNIPDDVIQLFPKGGSWDYFRDSISDMGTDYYYLIHDMDNNGVKELVIFNGDTPNALYTISGNEVIPVAFGAYRHQLKISDNGEIYLFSHGGHQDYQYSKFKFSEDGNNLKPVYYKGIDGNNPDGSLIYYSYPSISGKDFFNIEFPVMKEISESEFKQTEDEYNSVECTLERFPVKAFNKQDESESQTTSQTGTLVSSNISDILNMNYGQFKDIYGDIAINTTSEYYVAAIPGINVTFFGNTKQNSNGEFIGYELTDDIKAGAISGALSDLLNMDFGESTLYDIQEKLSNNKKSEYNIIYPRGLLYASYDFDNDGDGSFDYNLKIEISGENDTINGNETATLFKNEFKNR